MGTEDEKGMKNMPAFQIFALDVILGVIIILLSFLLIHEI